VRSDLSIRKEEVLDLMVEDRFQVIERNLVPALLARVLGAIGGHIHLLTTCAVRNPREEMYRRLRGALQLRPLAIEVIITFCPEVLGDYRLYLKVYPLGLGFQYPGTLAA